MGYLVGEARGQQTLFPVCLDELVPSDHFCRVLDAFVLRLDFIALGFERAEAAATGRPGYDPRDLLKLYLYGYLQRVRSSRRLEAECRRNVERMWLLGRLVPDHKSIAEFRRLHREAITEAGAEGVNHSGDGTLYDRSQFAYDDASDTLRCPAGETLRRKGLQKDRNRVLYTAPAQTCGGCALKSRCTASPQRYVYIYSAQRSQAPTQSRSHLKKQYRPNANFCE